jgi:hypothetical protein
VRCRWRGVGVASGARDAGGSAANAFPLAVKQHFYEAVARDFTDVQVIVFENDEPPASVANDATVSVFSGTAAGRRGFIP